jgi:hypothetical protein
MLLTSTVSRANAGASPRGLMVIFEGYRVSLEAIPSSAGGSLRRRVSGVATHERLLSISDEVIE